LKRGKDADSRNNAGHGADETEAAAGFMRRPGSTAGADQVLIRVHTNDGI